MYRIFLYPFLIIMQITFADARESCWENCTGHSNTTKSCVNRCGVQSPEEQLFCNRYCSSRGGSEGLCASLCGTSNNDNPSSPDDPSLDCARQINDWNQARLSCEIGSAELRDACLSALSPEPNCQ